MTNVIDFSIIKSSFEIKKRFIPDDKYEVEMNTIISVPKDEGKTETIIKYNCSFLRDKNIDATIEIFYVANIKTDETFKDVQQKNDKILNCISLVLAATLCNDVNQILSKMRFPPIPLISFISTSK